MKKAIVILFFINSFSCFSQELLKTGDKKIINKCLTLVKTLNGYVFIGPEGQESQKYDNVYINEDGSILTTILRPADKQKIRDKNELPYNNNITINWHVLNLMKELKFIDEYHFGGTNDLTDENISKGFVEDYGNASKDGKMALITNKGEFITALKYTNEFYIIETPVLNYYLKNKKLITVVIDHFSGKELLATKDSIAAYWDSDNYVLKNKRGKYTLVYNGKIQKTPKDFKSLNNNPPIASTIFTYNNGFFDSTGKKIESQLIPRSNFYKGHCIVMEIIKEKQKFNYYGEALPQHETRTLKIINEKFETIKTLPEITHILSHFNKYGQIIVEKSYEVPRSFSIENQYVIDYNGNEILPSTKSRNKIEEIYDGLYLDIDKTFASERQKLNRTIFYNQKGEKIVPENILQQTSYLGLKESLNENYLVCYGIVYVTLDKENNVINSSTSKEYYNSKKVFIQ